MADAADVARWQRWRAARAAGLSAPDSWLGVVGLFWLEEGANTVGSDPSAAVVLTVGPAVLGRIDCTGTTAVWRPVLGAPVPLQTDAGGAPTMIEHGALAFFVIERDGRLAARVRDRDWAARRPFAGIDAFAYDPAWRIEADWRPLDPPQTIEVPDAGGDFRPATVAWQAVFRVGDAEVSLLPMRVAGDGVFFVFRDATSGRTTYGAGRFLDAAPASGGRIVLDFNFACNPPCAFTSFATCPLPPPQNRLPFSVDAGELRYAGGH